VEALLQICSSFFSQSMKLYVVYRYLQCHRLAAFPAMISVFSSHMQGSHSVISNKPRLHNEINLYSYNKNRSASSWSQWCPATPFKICAPFSCLLFCYEQKNISVLIWFETIIEYWFNYSSSIKFSSATQALNIWKTFFVAHDVFHNAGNIFRWYLSLIVGVHLLLN